MAFIIYTLCATTSLICAALLLRAYLINRYKLLFWSFVFFAGVAINNVLLVADKLIFPELDLSVWRLPVFKTYTHLPPFMGVLLGLGLLWVAADFIHRDKVEDEKS